MSDLPNEDQLTSATTIAVTLKAYLVSTFTTQAEFARLLNVTDATVSKWMAGVNRPDRDIARKISRITRIPLEKLI